MHFQLKRHGYVKYEHDTHNFHKLTSSVLSEYFLYTGSYTTVLKLLASTAKYRFAIVFCVIPFLNDNQDCVNYLMILAIRASCKRCDRGCTACAIAYSSG